MARSPISCLAAPFARLPLFLVTVFVAMTLLGICSRQASAAIHYVSTTGTGNGSSWAASGPLQTIITAAHSGDQVWVKYGTYTGNFTATDGVAVYGHFAGTETSLTQRQLTNTTYATVLDGNSNGTVYTIPSSATRTNTLDGFTVQHGIGSDSTDGSLEGGGIYDYSADTLTVLNCTFTNDSANAGAGIEMGIGTASIIIRECVFTGNSSSYSNGNSGGGGALNAASSVTISDCMFSGNTTSGSGAAIHAYGTTTMISDCTFTDNNVSNSYSGAVDVNGTPTIENCIFGGSSATDTNSNEAVDLYAVGTSSTPAVVKNCLIIGSGVNGPSGIVVDPGGNQTSYTALTNNTIVDTNNGISIQSSGGSDTFGNNILYFCNVGINYIGSNVTLGYTNDDFEGSNTANYSSNLTPSATDLFDDPLFVSTANGDYQLQSSSPLVNAGDDSYVDDGDTDLAGNPRIYGSAVDIGAYEFYPTPTITSFSPTSGPVGTVITITGTNLTNILSVRFHNANAITYSVNGAGTQLTVTVPSGAGTGTITVTTRGGTVKTATNFTVTSATPTITSFSPTSGPIGTVVTITGTNFTGATSIKFDGTTATTFTVVSATSITATVPTGAATGKISVTTPGGTATSSGTFTVIPAPTITSFTPTSGPVGTVVTIMGTNLGGVTKVRFHNANAATYSVNGAGTQLTVTVPSGAGTGTITVTTPGGSVTSSQTFTVTASLPTVKTLTFNPATIAPGGVSTGTVTLSGPAPTGGSLVSIAQGAFDVAMVTIASGQTTGTFTVTASASAPAGSYVFTASYNSSSATATLTVN